MTNLYGVLDMADLDTIWTYEAESSAAAAALYLDGGEDQTGAVVRVFSLGRHAPAFIKAATGDVLLIADPELVRK